jgi:hypothetical protein
MAWWWNELVYFGLWFVLILSILLGVSLSPTKDTFVDTPDAIDLHAFFQPYHTCEVCDLFKPVYDSIVLSFNPLEGQAARDEADKEVKKHVPGGSLSCSLALPSSKDPQVIFNFLSSLPNTYLADVYATLLYSTATLQSNLEQIKSSLTTVPPTPSTGAVFESFEATICSPKEADKKRQAQVPTCILPEDVTPEALNSKSKEKLATLTSVLEEYKKKNTEPVPLRELSYTDLLQKGKDLLKEIQALKKKLETGDITPPQSEGFTDYFKLQYL